MLSNIQIRHLKGLAHHLKPVVSIGQHGLGENVIAEIELALNQHELLKLRIPAASKDEKKQLMIELCDKLSAEPVQLIGRTVSIFRRNKKRAHVQMPKA